MLHSVCLWMCANIIKYQIVDIRADLNLYLVQYSPELFRNVRLAIKHQIEHVTCINICSDQIGYNKIQKRYRKKGARKLILCAVMAQ